VTALRRVLCDGWAPLWALLLVTALQNTDVILVKHLASDAQAGAYAEAAVAAKALVWLAVGLGLLLLPEVARRAQQGRDTRRVLARMLLLVAAVAAPMIAVHAVAGTRLLDVVFGSADPRAGAALPILTAAMALLAASYLAVQYLLALGRQHFGPLLVAAAALQPLLVAVAAPDLVEVAVSVLAVEAVLVLGLLALIAERAPALRPAPSPRRA
jgi:O-antigen/teichoic acid export membrane protein